MWCLLAAQVYIQFEFLEVFSEVSSPVTTNLRMSVLPVSFAACKHSSRTALLSLHSILHVKVVNVFLLFSPRCPFLQTCHSTARPA